MLYKNFIFSILLTSTLFSQIPIDIALTIGYNKFDDPEFLIDNSRFYGVRVTTQPIKNYRVELGYEKATDVNCQGLNLTRAYVNGIVEYKESTLLKIKPYILGTVGYEDSNIHRFKPSQIFVGAGLGIKKDLPKNFNSFIETRVIQKLESHDTDIITTLGIGYHVK
jgi:hypothetical protein